ncbi:hypothetical protein [Haloarcula argentinensis]|uniref:SIR2-like domain-containing protein n=1 Tax=Haloarcula argentinensis TaxID=43776 RepID=A0A830FX97_HALAR|nr:hypothetical protein [Haloarcula argentinensis]GGM52678.1 hypothetical protein GCM10009006_37270 [Haloarcula argentinensis]
MENLVLIGAGASTGADKNSGGIHPEQPPLGWELFDRLSSKYPQAWGALPDSIQEDFTNDFEQGMETLGEDHSQLYAPLYRAMGDYFARFRILSSPTWYDRLISELESSISSGETAFASLNYECLLELALSQNGFDINYFPDQLSEQSIVLKPHGSCNFISDSVQAQGGVSFTEGVRFSGGIRAVDLDEVIQYCRSNTALYPAMSLFRPDKHIQIGHSVIQDLQKNWANAVEEANKIAIIGVKPRKSDEHIWGQLSKTNADIYYIGGEEPFNDWRNDNRANSQDEFISDRFHTGFADLIDRLQ